jgi:hypothetical protein
MEGNSTLGGYDTASATTGKKILKLKRKFPDRMRATTSSDILGQKAPVNIANVFRPNT